MGQLEDDELHAAIRDGIISPTLKRSDLDEWLEAKNYRTKPIERPKLNLPDVFYAAIRLTHEPSSEQIERLDRMLDRIRLEFDAEIIRPRDRYAEAMSRWMTRIAKNIRNQARRIVRDTKRRALSRVATKTHRKTSKQERAKAWGFTWDETFIDDDADEQRIRDVLDCIGRGDEFDKLREQAYSQIEQPTPPATAETAENRQRSLEELAAHLRKQRRRKKPDLTKFLDFK